MTNFFIIRSRHELRCHGTELCATSFQLFFAYTWNHLLVDYKELDITQEFRNIVNFLERIIKHTLHSPLMDF